MENGYIYGINGPVVAVKGTDGLKMMEMVKVGKDKLIGEVIGLESDRAIVQVYEETTSVSAGEEVVGLKSPMSALLGPGLIGSIFDGIQRPLLVMEKQSGAFIERGMDVSALDTEKKWNVRIKVKNGDSVKGGDIVAETDETESIVHKIMVPPDMSGEVVFAANDGDYTINDVIVKIKNSAGKVSDITLCHKWPIRKARPYTERKTPTEPLVTGQRVIDALFPIAKGGAAAIPGGFGTGKTMTQHQLAKWCDADIIVYIGCGERGNEMTQVLEDFTALIDPRTGKSLMNRTILIANTSNMPVRRRLSGRGHRGIYRSEGYSE